MVPDHDHSHVRLSFIAVISFGAKLSLMPVAVDFTDLDLWVRGVPYREFARLRSDAPAAWFDEAAHTDPPAHTKLRKILSGSFTQRAVAVYEHLVSGLTEQVLNGGLPGDTEPFDFLDAVAKEVPISVLARIMSLLKRNLPLFIDLGDRLIANTDPEITDVVWGRDDTDAYRLFPFRSPYGKQLWDLGRDIMRERVSAPGDDLLSTLLRAEVDGDQLSETDLDNFFSIMVNAGNGSGGSS
jgi:cytochrome P450